MRQTSASRQWQRGWFQQAVAVPFIVVVGLFIVMQARPAAAQFGIDCRDAIAALYFEGGQFGDGNGTLAYVQTDFSLDRAITTPDQYSALSTQLGDLVAATTAGALVSAQGNGDFPALRSAGLEGLNGLTEIDSGDLVGFQRGDSTLMLIPSNGGQAVQKIPVIDQETGTQIVLMGSDIAFDPVLGQLVIQNQRDQLLSITIDRVAGKAMATSVTVKDGPDDISSAAWIADDGSLLTYHGSGSIWQYDLPGLGPDGVTAQVLSTDLPITASADAAPCRSGASVQVLPSAADQDAMVPGTYDSLNIAVRNNSAQTLIGVIEPVGPVADWFTTSSQPVRVPPGEIVNSQVQVKLPTALGSTACFQVQLRSNVTGQGARLSDDPSTTALQDRTCFIAVPTPDIGCSIDMATSTLIPGQGTFLAIELSNAATTSANSLTAALDHNLINHSAGAAMCSAQNTCAASNRSTMDAETCALHGLTEQSTGLSFANITLPGGLPSEPAKLCVSVPLRLSPDATEDLVVTGSADYRGKGFPCASHSQTLSPTADVAVTIDNMTEVFAPNQPQEFTVEISNAGPSDAVNLGYINEMPLDIDGVQRLDQGCECGGAGSIRSADERTALCQASLSSIQAKSNQRQIFIDNITLPAGCKSTLEYEVNYR